MQVSEIMTRGVISLAPADSLEKAARLMLQYEISGFPVLDRGRLVGIVTEGDFLRRVELGTERHRRRWIEFLTTNERLADEFIHAHSRTVADVMTREVITVAPESDLEKAVQLMEQHRVKRLPVIKGDAVVGVVSRSDLLRAFIVASKRTQNARVGDDTIRERLATELERIAWVPHGSVVATVQNGIVDLQGIIADENQRAALRVAAANVIGVKEVHDHLQEYAEIVDD